MILEQVNLKFDPEKGDYEIRKIFSNDMSRLLWLAIKQGHIASQFFNDFIIKRAPKIEKITQERPITARELYDLLIFGLPHYAMIGPDEYGFIEELLPFVNGEKGITFTVKR